MRRATHALYLRSNPIRRSPSEYLNGWHTHSLRSRNLFLFTLVITLDEAYSPLNNRPRRYANTGHPKQPSKDNANFITGGLGGQLFQQQPSAGVKRRRDDDQHRHGSG
jgi:hypothetical protein